MDLGTVSVAVTATPPVEISQRQQIRDQLTWVPQKGTHRARGTGEVDLPNAHLALVMLSIGSTYVQRQWYNDPKMAKNGRFLAAQEFDHDITKIKEHLQSSDSRAFEKAVAALMFLSGFAQFQPLKDEAPDVIGITPGGTFLLVECTVKTTDAVAKIGNLVSRREALREALARAKQFHSILAILVCKAPRSHILATDAQLAEHDVLLIAHEGLERQAHRVQSPVSADAMVANGVELLRRLKARVLPPAQ